MWFFFFCYQVSGYFLRQTSGHFLKTLLLNLNLDHVRLYDVERLCIPADRVKAFRQEKWINKSVCWKPIMTHEHNSSWVLALKSFTMWRIEGSWNKWSIRIIYIQIVNIQQYDYLHTDYLLLYKYYVSMTIQLQCSSSVYASVLIYMRSWQVALVSSTLSPGGVLKQTSSHDFIRCCFNK